MQLGRMTIKDWALDLINSTPMKPGSIHGLHVVVPDIERARTELAGQRIDHAKDQH